MKPVERYHAVLEGRRPDYLPRIPILMGFAAREIGASYAEFASDHRVLVEANLRCAERYGLDQLSAISDPYRETTGFGGEIEYQADGPPRLLRPPLADSEDLSILRQPDPEKTPRMRDRLDAIRAFARQVGGQYSIMGWVEGPAAQAASLRGVTDFLAGLIEEEEFSCQLMDHCLETAIEFARAQVHAGADTIGIGDAIASQVGPDLYRRLILPREKQLIRAIQSDGAATRVHICGDISPLLPFMSALGTDILDVDWQVDPAAARAGVGPRTALAGFLDPVSTVSAKDPATIRGSLAGVHARAGDPFMVAAGCEIPAATPPENLLALCEPLVPAF